MAAQLLNTTRDADAESTTDATNATAIAAATAGAQIAGTYEFIERIMLHMRLPDLLTSRTINKSFAHVYHRSAQIPRMLRMPLPEAGSRAYLSTRQIGPFGMIRARLDSAGDGLSKLWIEGYKYQQKKNKKNSKKANKARQSSDRSWRSVVLLDKRPREVKFFWWGQETPRASYETKNTRAWKEGFTLGDFADGLEKYLEMVLGREVKDANVTLVFDT